MQELRDLLRVAVPQKRFNQRNESLKELYGFYKNDTLHRKIANWKRYKQLYSSDTVMNQEKFKKSKYFIKVLPEKVFAIKLSHLKQEDLYYTLSVARDKNNRSENVCGFISSLFLR